MKLNRYTLAFGIAALAFTACENELKKDAELNIGVETSDAVGFDGQQTITVKKGTPVNFLIDGDPDYLTFFSGEIGAEYRNRERTTVSMDDIESSKLSVTIEAQYGNPADIMEVRVAEDFQGLTKTDFAADSVLVDEGTDWQTLIDKAPSKTEPGIPQVANFNAGVLTTIDMTPYLNRSITLGFRYKGVSNTAVQSKFYFRNLQIENVMKNGQVITLDAKSFGFTALNMYYRHPDVLNTQNRRNVLSGKPYATVTNNTSGVWNLANMTNFFIHSSPTGSPLMYVWLVSDKLVINACTPDSGVGIKNITEDLNTYSHTYDKVGTYTATFVGRNANYKQQTEVVREYTVNVIE